VDAATSAGTAVEAAPSVQNKVRRSGDFNAGLSWPGTTYAAVCIVSIARRIVLFIASHCSCARGFFVAVSRPCIVNGGGFPLQIACIFFLRPGRRGEAAAAPMPNFGRMT
jgi:hypothetical protein